MRTTRIATTSRQRTSVIQRDFIDAESYHPLRLIPVLKIHAIQSSASLQ
jgi:hypothetical protein